MSQNLDVGSLFADAINTAFSELGSVTIMVAGGTGVGKSSLVNAIFAWKMANTGQGLPITDSAVEHIKEGIPLRIIDTQGLETNNYEGTRAALEKLLDERQREPVADRHIHAAWVCVSEDLRRVQQSDIELHEMLRKRNIPVIAVVTKARMDKDQNGDKFSAVVQQLLPHAANVVRVRAETEEDDDGYVRKPKGLTDLVEATMDVLPQSVKDAFAAAQKVSIDLKVARARRIMLSSATAAGGVAFSPIPFSDAAVIVPIQLAMLASISATFGLPMTEAALMTLVSTVFGAGGAALAGRAIVTGLLKLIPGAGTVAGGFIAAATASALTVSLGEAYIATLRKLFESRAGEVPTEKDVAEEFKRQLSLKAD